MKFINSFVLMMIIGLCFACQNEPQSKSKRINIPLAKPVEVLQYVLEGKLPHSNNSFTEGLFFHAGELFESTGSPENLPQTLSVFGIVDSLTGEIHIHHQLDPKYFGEGISILNGKIYQLTYKSREGFVYDLASNKRLRSFQIPTKEGWGMTTDGESLIMSDGTANLHFIDPNSLEKTGTIKVIDNGRPLVYLNELEYVDGFIYANVYTTNWVVKIDISTGKVVGRLDLTDLKLAEDQLSTQALELNGIAHNPEKNTFLFTGKMWQNIYEVRLLE